MAHHHSLPAAMLGPNPMEHLIQRQLGNNISTFRSNLFRERINIAKNLYKRDLVSHFGCVNAIEFSRDGNLLISGGDDRRVLLWRLGETLTSEAQPISMEKQHQSNIFCLGFNSNNTSIFSGGNDDTVIVHDVKTGEPTDAFLHSKPVYGLSVDPTNDDVFASAGEDGRVLVFDLRKGTDVIAFTKYRAPFHAVQFHPFNSNFAITANGKEGAALWDMRHTTLPYIRYGGEDSAQSCMSVRFNSMGTQVLALRRRLPPILYNTQSSLQVCQFYHPDYYNSCTMKSCCFAGENEELVLSGSDDFNLYAWRVTDADLNKTNQWVDTHKMVLYGHRSIVNQVRYNPQKCLIASSGVEKVIKLWQPFAMDGWTGALGEEINGCENPRDVFSHDEYVSLVNTSGSNMTHDYSNQNTTEDPRMMAFFDSLVQREIEGWNSNENSESDKGSQYSSDGSSRPTSSIDDSSDSDDDGDGGGGGGGVVGDAAVAGGSSRNSISGVPNDLPFFSAIDHRRGGNRIPMKPRTIYANRIAYLIATKRNTLKRLALKGSAHSDHRRRRVKSSRIGNRKLNLRITRKGNGKRSGRSGLSKRTIVSHEDNSDDDVPKNLTKKRIQQHLTTSAAARRSFRRKSKSSTNNNNNNNRRFESPNDSSSDDNGQRSQSPVATSSTCDRNLPSTSAASSNNHLQNPNIQQRHQYRFQKYANSTSATTSAVQYTSSPDDDTSSDDNDNNRSNNNNNNIHNNDEKQITENNDNDVAGGGASTSNNYQQLEQDQNENDEDIERTSSNNDVSFPINIAVPSTSTGITANGRSFRIAQQQQQSLIDSDDDQTPQNSATESPVNFLRIIPTPHNGGTYNLNIAYSSDNDNDYNPPTTTNRQLPLQHNHHHHHHHQNHHNHHNLHHQRGSSSTSSSNNNNNRNILNSSNNQTNSHHHHNNHNHHHHHHHQVRRKRTNMQMSTSTNNIAGPSTNNTNNNNNVNGGNFSSNSRLSTSGSPDEEDVLSSTDSFTPLFQHNNRKRKITEQIYEKLSSDVDDDDGDRVNNNDNDNDNANEDNDNDNDSAVDDTIIESPSHSITPHQQSIDNLPNSSNNLSMTKTPNRRAYNSMDFTPDSGITSINGDGGGSVMNSGGCSSSNGMPSSTTSNNNNNSTNHHQSNSNQSGSCRAPSISNDDQHIFQHKLAKIRRNYRMEFADDSDSD